MPLECQGYCIIESRVKRRWGQISVAVKFNKMNIEAKVHMFLLWLLFFLHKVTTQTKRQITRQRKGEHPASNKGKLERN